MPLSSTEVLLAAGWISKPGVVYMFTEICEFSYDNERNYIYTKLQSSFIPFYTI